MRVPLAHAITTGPPVGVQANASVRQALPPAKAERGRASVTSPVEVLGCSRTERAYGFASVRRHHVALECTGGSQ